MNRKTVTQTVMRGHRGTAAGLATQFHRHPDFGKRVAHLRHVHRVGFSGGQGRGGDVDEAGKDRMHGYGGVKAEPEGPIMRRAVRRQEAATGRSARRPSRAIVTLGGSAPCRSGRLGATAPEATVRRTTSMVKCKARYNKVAMDEPIATRPSGLKGTGVLLQDRTG